MKTLIAHRHLVRKNWLFIISFCLLLYFSYHAAFGERSYIRLHTLERQAQEVSLVYEEAHRQRIALESRVVKLRPGSIDADLLEERVHYVLGYYRPDEQVFLNRTGNGT